MCLFKWIKHAFSRLNQERFNRSNSHCITNCLSSKIFYIISCLLLLARTCSQCDSIASSKQSIFIGSVDIQLVTLRYIMHFDLASFKTKRGVFTSRSASITSGNEIKIIYFKGSTRTTIAPTCTYNWINIKLLF